MPRSGASSGWSTTWTTSSSPSSTATRAGEILREHGWPEEYIRAVLSHGWGICTDVEPQTDLEKTLYAMDELTGLVAATAIVRPSKSVLDMEPKSVKKKWKEKSFAAGVNREVIEKGAALLGVDLNELIDDAIAGCVKRPARSAWRAIRRAQHEREFVKRETGIVESRLVGIRTGGDAQRADESAGA